MNQATEQPPTHPNPKRKAFVAVTTGILVTWALHNLLLLPWEEARWPDSLRLPAQLLLRFLVWMVPVALYLKRYETSPSLAALRVNRKIDLRGLLIAALPAAAYLGLVVLLTSASETEESVGFGSALLSLLGVYALLGVLLEELLMRGFILGQLLQWRTPRSAQLRTALLFSLMHLPGWISQDGLHIGLLPSAIIVFLQGSVLGFLTVKSRSLLPAILVHWLNNLLAM